MRDMSRAVYLHVGAPRTGSSYLHRRLVANREQLTRHGVHVPVAGGQTAVDDLLERRDCPADVAGQWDQLARATRRLDGTAIISNDALAGARPEQARRALESFPGAEAHLVYVVRDLARQLPAEWQESLKRGRSWTYARFLERTVERRGAAARHFWRSQDVSDVLRRWTAGLPPEQVHVIVAPAGDPTPQQRWALYSAALGIDPSWAPTDVNAVSPPLSVSEAGALRALNRRLQSVDHDATERRALLRAALTARRPTEAVPRQEITLRPDLYAWAAGLTEEWIDWLQGSGVDVHGDPDDLWSPLPDPDAEWVDPDRADEGAVAETALDLLASVTALAAGRRTPEQPGAFARAARLLRGGA